MPLAPDRLIMDSPGLEITIAAQAAMAAAELARSSAPKLSGYGSRNIDPIWGHGFFGLHFLDYMWIQNVGARPFVMRSLAGKTIPMWIDDPTGEERRNNPKAQTRTTASGKTQVLIFRKAAHWGERKLVRRKAGGIETEVSVPKSYPGAPGRISIREAPHPFTTTGRVGGRVARGNVGIRWYFPGLAPRLFLHNAIEMAALQYGVMGSLKTAYSFIEQPHVAPTAAETAQEVS